MPIINSHNMCLLNTMIQVGSFVVILDISEFKLEQVCYAVFILTSLKMAVGISRFRVGLVHYTTVVCSALSS